MRNETLINVSKSFRNATRFKDFEVTAKDINLVYDYIKGTLSLYND
jgi:hypothetical protein